jgi:type 1 fimbriae regulatory protein FimB
MSAAATVVPFPQKKTVRHRLRGAYLTPEQLKAFLKSAKRTGAREHAMFLFAVAHGVRAQEICNLRLSDLSLSNGTVHIERLKGSLKSTQLLLKVEGNSLMDERKAFEAWLKIRRPQSPGDYVFTSRKSKTCGQMNRVTVFKIFKWICGQAGIPETHQHVHSLKHTCAHLMLANNANAFLIRQQLGHASFNSTLEYTKPTDLQASVAFAEAVSAIVR